MDLWTSACRWLRPPAPRDVGVDARVKPSSQIRGRRERQLGLDARRHQERLS